MRTGIQGISPAEYKNPFDEKYLGHPERITKTQKWIWPYISNIFGAKWGLIGGKGAAKTMTLAAWLVDGAQRYPGSKSFIAAATYTQAIDSCATELVTCCDIMNLEVIYRKSMIIDRKEHKYVYYFPKFDSAVCIRSADNMDIIEGSQWDRGGIEEVSFWNIKDLRTALSRIRRTRGDNGKGIVGMPADPEFWMYEFLEKWCTVADDGQRLFKEISTRENLHNLAPGYLQELYELYPGPLATKYIDGGRVSLDTIPVLHSYRYDLHRKGKLSQKYTGYDPYLPLIISFDFNVAPVTCTLWQRKMIKYADSTNPLGFREEETLCQIDEFEGWYTGTKGVCQSIYEEYGDHTAGGIVLGDASGNADDTRSVGVTDWTIIEEILGDMRNMRIRKGLIVNRNTRTGGKRRRRSAKEKLAKYDNPPLKDSIINVNRLLLDGKGIPHIIFLPESKYPSGGCASSCAGMKYAPDGKLDESNDKLSGKEVVRGHYFATTRYVAWYFSPPRSTRRKSKKTRGVSEYQMQNMRDW